MHNDVVATSTCSMSHLIIIDHHNMHLLVGFIGDPTGQLNTSANSGELTTARALQLTIHGYTIGYNIFSQSMTVIYILCRAKKRLSLFLIKV